MSTPAAPDHVNDALYRLLFRLRIHESSGDGFQSLFGQIMKYSDPRFQKIVPWGEWGDGGNDGWIEEDGHYFQVYGPKPTTKLSETAALNKAIEDFDKLPKKWQNVQMYSFVMNDRFAGIPAPIGSALQDLKTAKKLKAAKAVETQDLMIVFMTLTVGERQDIVGGIPESADFIDSRALGELLTGLAETATGKLTFLKEKAPDFDEKIKFNGLTPPISIRLESASYQANMVDEFLDGRDPGLRQAIAQEIREYYQESKAEFPDDVPDFANLRYLWLLDRIMPPNAPKHAHTQAAYRGAAEIVLAKYFESCDVYEYPDSASTP